MDWIQRYIKPYLYLLVLYILRNYYIHIYLYKLLKLMTDSNFILTLIVFIVNTLESI